MTMKHMEVAQKRPLEILGISEPEERVYRWLLTHPGVIAPEIAEGLELSPRKTQRLLDTIEAKGLTTHAPERPRRYIPASPDIAVEALVRHRQEELDLARMSVAELQQQVAQSSHDHEQMVELITSGEAEHQIFDQMQQAAQREIISLVRPPVRMSRLDIPHDEDQRAQREAQARGVRYRSIVDTAFLSIPGTVDGVRSDMKAGEEVKVFPSLPFKLFLADRRIAVIPLSLERPNGPVLLVRSSALLDALYALFEILWERAAPLSFIHAGVLEIGGSGSQLPEGAEDLISLMAAGLNDKKIARELGLSIRTLCRRISELMKSFDAQTRFQFGWLAALRLSGVKSNADQTS